MSDTGHSKWRKLDNAALAFLAVAGKNDTRVFRFYCQLTQEVEPEFLKAAVNKTLDRYPLFQAVLRKGLFWFYLEQKEIPVRVEKEKRPPCSRLYTPDKKSLLFEVSYYKDRINFEIFHGLTDGTGAMEFLLELVQNYVQIAHPKAKLPDRVRVEDVTDKDQEEDSFAKYYSGEPKGKPQSGPKAYQLKGEKAIQDELPITEMVLSVREALARAKSHGVSLTIYLAALFLCAIWKDVPACEKNRLICLMVPVNLRNFFPSNSMANFFCWIEVGMKFEEDTTFADVLETVKEQFARELDKERLARRMDQLVALEKNPMLRPVPLAIKNIAVSAGTHRSGESITAVLSNVGVIRLPEEYQPYIQRFGFFTSTNKMQMCTCSYGDELVLGLTCRFKDNNTSRNLQRLFREEELTCRVQENDFPGYEKKPKHTVQTIFKLVSFLCVAVAVISGLLNYSMQHKLNWSLLVMGGCACTWMSVLVAVKKWRNPLKGIFWQQLLLSAVCLLWDILMGWRGWSIDFVLPSLSFFGLVSIFLVSRIGHMELTEYLYHLIQACVLGCIPFLLVVLGLCRYEYLAIACGGFSFLFLVGILIFRRKASVQELQKKFRL